MVVKSLESMSYDGLYSVWAEAFKDYARSWTSDEYKKMLVRRGYNPSLSFGAFDGDRLVSFVLNGIGEWNSKKTAYDTGTGTIPEYRGKGLVKNIFIESIPFLKNADVKQCLLEVLDNNDKAIKIYKNLGFKVEREFNYFIQNKDAIVLNANKIENNFLINPINLEIGNQINGFWDFTPSWQNCFDSLSRETGGFITLGLYNENLLIGYGIIEPSSGDIPQLAIHPDFRRRGLATTLLAELLKYNQAPSIRVINTDKKCTNITAFLESWNIQASGGQYEMILDL